MPAYLGLSTSLYPSIAEKHVAIIEEAIQARNEGQASKAIAAYENDLMCISHLPIYLIEYSKLLMDYGLYGQVYRLLDKPIRELEGQSDVLDLPEWRLLAMNRAIVMVQHTGILDPGVAELSRNVKWLANVAVSDYTDIQVLSRMSGRSLFAYSKYRHPVRIAI